MKKKLFLGFTLVFALSIAWFLLSPLFLNETVDEKLTSKILETDTSPKIVKKGLFKRADEKHQGSGEVFLYQNPDKSYFVRFENFNVTNGPDLVVYLTKHANPIKKSDVEEGFVKLAKLKGNIGNQNYTIPKELDISEFKSVVIWCELFGVLFSPAALK